MIWMIIAIFFGIPFYLFYKCYTEDGGTGGKVEQVVGIVSVIGWTIALFSVIIGVLI